VKLYARPEETSAKRVLVEICESAGLIFALVLLLECSQPRVGSLFLLSPSNLLSVRQVAIVGVLASVKPSSSPAGIDLSVGISPDLP